MVNVCYFYLISWFIIFIFKLVKCNMNFSLIVSLFI